MFGLLPSPPPRYSKDRGRCARSPVVTVTMRDTEEVAVEDSKVHGEGMDDTGAVVVLTAAPVRELKHA